MVFGALIARKYCSISYIIARQFNRGSHLG
jgi:hypothetical protein